MLESFWPFENFYKTEIEITETNKKQLYVFLENNKQFSGGDQITSYGHTSILKLPALSNLKNQIDKITESINLKVDESWAQLYKKGNSHYIHRHKGSVYSGVVYVDGPKAEGTTFVSPLLHEKKFSTFSSNFENNSVILFPSSMLHYVNVHEEEEPRLIISFNTQNRKDL